MLNISNKRHSRRLITSIIVGVVVLVGLAAAYYVWQQLPRQNTETQKTTTKEEAAPTPQKMESRMLVMGDVFWGRYISDWSMASSLKYAYPFHKLGEFEREKYDAWIADLECPVTNNPKVSSAVEDSTLKFDCAPEYLTEAKKWFTAFTLANNHTDNQGAEGMAETRRHLEENQIQYFGTYDPEDYENLCDIISVPAKITLSNGTVTNAKLPLVWCGYHGVFKNPSQESMQVMNRYQQHFNVIAMPHSGVEYKPEPDAIKTTFYRGLVDNGADVVIGGHPHWIQTSEAYRGKLVMYSLGNFIFDQQDTAEVTRGAVLDMTLSVNAADAPDLEAWLALGEQCTKYQDDCLQYAVSKGLKKLPLKYHFQIVGSNDSGKVAHRADAAGLESIKNRLRWQSTISGLSGANSGQ